MSEPADAWVFFLLVFTLSVPFYLIGLTGLRLLGLPMLPLSALIQLRADEHRATQLHHVQGRHLS